MKTAHHLITLVSFAAILTTASAHAATVTQSATAPTDFILAQPLFGGSLDGSHDYSNNDGAPGQTFTTGSTGFTLDAVTVLGGGSSGNGQSGLEIRIDLVTNNGTTLQTLDNENAVINVGNNNSNYITFTLDNPVTLAANTQYAYSINGLDAGFTGFAKSNGDVLAGGFAMQSGSAYDSSADGDLITSPQGNDRTFYLQGVAAPEPGTWAMMIGGLLVLVAIQRRRFQS